MDVADCITTAPATTLAAATAAATASVRSPARLCFQPLHPEAGALLHNEHTIAVVDEPYGRVMSWICLLDQFDISATITGVRWRYCAFENLLGLWSGHSLVSSQNTTLQVHTFLCAKSLKPRSSPRPLVRCGTWSLGHSWHTDQGIDHRCFRPHLEQRGWRR